MFRMARVILVLFWLAVIVTAFLTQILSCFRRDKVKGVGGREGWGEGGGRESRRMGRGEGGWRDGERGREGG